MGRSAFMSCSSYFMGRSALVFSSGGLSGSDGTEPLFYLLAGSVLGQRIFGSGVGEDMFISDGRSSVLILGGFGL